MEQCPSVWFVHTVSACRYIQYNTHVQSIRPSTHTSAQTTPTHPSPIGIPHPASTRGRTYWYILTNVACAHLTSSDPSSSQSNTPYTRSDTARIPACGAADRRGQVAHPCTRNRSDATESPSCRLRRELDHGGKSVARPRASACPDRRRCDAWMGGRTKRRVCFLPGLRAVGSLSGCVQWWRRGGKACTVPYRTVPYRTVPYRTVPALRRGGATCEAGCQESMSLAFMRDGWSMTQLEKVRGPIWSGRAGLRRGAAAANAVALPTLGFPCVPGECESRCGAW